MRSLACLLGLVVVVLVGASPTGAQEAPIPSEPSVDCVSPEFLSHALADCVAGFDLSVEPVDVQALETDVDASTSAPFVTITAEPLVFPSFCRRKVDVIVWGGAQWPEIAQALADDLSPCAEYYVTIPPQGGNNVTLLRDPQVFEDIRALSPRIHPVAELRYTAPNRTDWRDLALTRGGDLEDFYDVGVVARRRMAMGTPPRIDLAAGETWAFNELTTEVLENVPGWRAEVRAFLAGLYDGPPGAPKERGVVFNVAPQSDVQEVAGYKTSLQHWLQDEAFWGDLDRYADFFAHEVYANPDTWGVAGVPLARRADSLNDYLFHLAALAEAGPDAVAAARDFLRRTYVPLTNASWPHRLIGETDRISAETMGHFVSTQVYAIRHYANSHPQIAPGGRIGLGWAPDAFNPAYTPLGRDLVRKRLAIAIQQASDRGTNSQMGACGLPGEHVWCAGEVDGAALNDAWATFRFWDS
jgi:hypothetical protein